MGSIDAIVNQFRAWPWPADVSENACYSRPVAVYTIAQLTIHNRDRYERYISAFLPVLTQYGGRVLAADDNPEVIDGPWHGDRVVLLEFPDRDSYVAWATSADYQHIATDRTASADMVALLVHGLT